MSNETNKENTASFNDQRLYFMKQKENIENQFLELGKIKVNVFNFIKFIKILQQLFLVSGAFIVSSMMRFDVINNNDQNYIMMIESLQRQIKILNDRIKKIEGK